MIKIKNIKPNSTADKLGIEAGDKVISIDGNKIKDYIEYNYLIADFNFKLKTEKINGEIVEYDVTRSYDKELGIELENIVYDGLNKCKNKCIFCFVDQEPPNLRNTLNIKDDDYRFSFLQGSYITLTNLDQEDFDRIVKYNLSPLNISVHTTNPKLRKFMMKNPNAANILKQLEFLASHNIDFNTQLVLCPEINDGDYLNKSIKDLSNFYPNILSIAVVPVGLTKYKNNNLRIFTKEESKQVLNQVQKWQKVLKNKFNNNFLYASDEFYLTTDIDIPDYNHYNDFPQLENGVGLTRIFRDEYDKIKDRYINLINNNNKEKDFHIITSVLGKKAIKPVIDNINSSQDKVNIVIEVVKNSFFGETVTVTGLLTAQDIEKSINSIESKNILLPKIVLNDNNKFIDDVNIDDFKKRNSDKNIYLCNNIKNILEVLGDVKTSSSNCR
ncbi:MAG: DUF512 domain-containing protein [Bacillota bacterium]